MKKKHIKIIGTYGDTVKLYPDGFVGTKYGDFLKIKSVDFVKKHIDLYGEGILDFSRISFSTPNNIKARKAYKENLNFYFNNLGISVNSLIKLKFTDDEGDEFELMTVSEIIYPTFKEDDYCPIIKVEDTLIRIDNFADFSRTLYVDKEETLEDKLTKLLKKHTDHSGDRLMNKTKYTTELAKLIKEL